MNDQVEYYLDFFTNRNRKTFSAWLARSSRYLPMIKKELALAGLPLDLAYLPMIESGFSTTASSPASAVGAWQFMRATGRSYGLKVNKYVDERRDPVKSTKAAVAYLSNLYKQFDSWHLAVAAYNAGEGKIKRAMKQSETDDFWEIAKSQYIYSETKLYVPQLIAAIMIAKDPEKYGFDDIDYDEPLDYETVRVPRGTPIKAVAVACNLADEEILALNRHLSKAITPPSEANYPLRVPPGKKDLVVENLPKVRQVTVTKFNTHVVKRGETLTTIRRKYKLSKTTLLKANNLEQERLSLGQHLRIPCQTTAYKLGDEPLHLDRAGAGTPLFSIRTEPAETRTGKKNKARGLKKKKTTKIARKSLRSPTPKKKTFTPSAKKKKAKKSPEPSPKSGSGKKS
jgi:membrane-bound lytic murein transglycosylase D